MDACNAPKPDKGNFLVIRIILPAPFDPATATRNVTYGIPQSKPKEANDDVSTLIPFDDKLGSFFPPQPFNLNFANIDVKGFEWAKVKIIILDTRYKFIIDDDPESGPIEDKQTRNSFYLGASVGSNKSKSTLCDPDIGYTNNVDATGTRYQFVSFFIKIKKNGKSMKGGFSFRLIPVNAADTPIFIDPKIHNEG